MSYGTNYSTKELQELLTEMMFVKAQGSEIQKNFDFTKEMEDTQGVLYTGGPCRPIGLQSALFFDSLQS